MSITSLEGWVRTIHGTDGFLSLVLGPSGVSEPKQDLISLVLCPTGVMEPKQDWISLVLCPTGVMEPKHD